MDSAGQAKGPLRFSRQTLHSPPVTVAAIATADCENGADFALGSSAKRLRKRPFGFTQTLHICNVRFSPGILEKPHLNPQILLNGTE